MLSQENFITKSPTYFLFHINVLFYAFLQQSKDAKKNLKPIRNHGGISFSIWFKWPTYNFDFKRNLMRRVIFKEMLSVHTVFISQFSALVTNLKVNLFLIGSKVHEGQFSLLMIGFFDCFFFSQLTGKSKIIIYKKS